eukprot:CAMPEP_0115439264 /NCGR_PEP_ID=MMETSP0271-20121206/35686_1 /TAXON_ID=71861 /ORGANISM="Scrippsiella trochoidea, Strain CCMP3099" /LENGTH=34 /DNA_ID= /DNA_START= /DNA_END= /DNA_ORIENTATION=
MITQRAPAKEESGGSNGPMQSYVEPGHLLLKDKS